jgi:hypothetical protein
VPESHLHFASSGASGRLLAPVTLPPAATNRVVHQAEPRLQARWPVVAPVGVVALGIVLLVHGFAPGLLNTTGWNYLIEGDMRCLSDMGLSALTSSCHAFGGAAGYPFLTSGPIVYLGWALIEITSMSSYSAYVIAGVVCDAIALAGAYGLLRTLGIRRPVALIASVAYLISPTIVGLRDFGGTFTGMTLLPTLALVDLLMIRAFERGGRTRIAATVGGYAAAKAFILFLDGYSFTVSVLITGALWLWWLAFAGAPRRTRVTAAASLLACHALAVALYRWYAPPVLGAEPTAFLRSMGIDVTTLIVPSHYVWVADLFGTARDHSALWGDGTNSAYNYVGVTCVVLAGVAIVVRRRQHYVVALGCAGLIAFVLSLGPALKVSDVRGPASGRPTSASYLMPANAATAEFPWGPVFRLPGPAQVRATYRWSATARLVLVVLAALGVDWLLRRQRGRTVGVLLGLLAVAGLAPNVPLLLSEYRDHYRSRAAFDASLVSALRTATRPGETAFFVNSDADYNDYLVNYLAPTVKLSALNAGGDKNAWVARSAWPTPIADLTRPNAGRAQAARALESRVVDVLILPYFDLRWDAYAWPPNETSRADAIRHFTPLLTGSGVSVRRFRWFATIRLAQ